MIFRRLGWEMHIVIFYPILGKKKNSVWANLKKCFFFISLRMFQDGFVLCAARCIFGALIWSTNLNGCSQTHHDPFVHLLCNKSVNCYFCWITLNQFCTSTRMNAIKSRQTQYKWNHFGRFSLFSIFQIQNAKKTL